MLDRPTVGDYYKVGRLRQFHEPVYVYRLDLAPSLKRGKMLAAAQLCTTCAIPSVLMLPYVSTACTIANIRKLACHT